MKNVGVGIVRVAVSYQTSRLRWTSYRRSRLRWTRYRTGSVGSVTGRAGSVLDPLQDEPAPLDELPSSHQVGNDPAGQAVCHHVVEG